MIGELLESNTCGLCLFRGFSSFLTFEIILSGGLEKIHASWRRVVLRDVTPLLMRHPESGIEEVGLVGSWMTLLDSGPHAFSF